MEKMADFYQDVRLEKLENGLELLYKYFPGQIVGAAVLVKAGSEDEGEFIGSGIAHLTEHITFEGRKDLENKLRKLGALSNAYTTFDHTLYYLEVPRQNLEKALELFLPAIFKPSISKDVFEREREVVLKEEKFRDDDPASLVTKIGFERSYINHPYKYPIIGEAELLKALTLQDLQQFQSRRYVPNNAVLSVAGELDFEKLRDFVRSETKNFSPGPLLKENFPYRRKNFSTQYSEYYGGSLEYVFISFPGVSLFDPELEVLDLLSDYLGWGKNSASYLEFVKAGICYNVSTFSYTPYLEGLLGFVALLEVQKINLFREKFKKFLDKIKEGGLDNERIERLKKKTVYDFLKSQETPLSIIQSLGRDQGLAGDYKFSLQYLEKFLKLNQSDLKAAALKYLDFNSVTETLLLPRQAMSVQVKPKENKREFKRIKYPNGLRLIMGRSEISPLTAVNILFQGGVRFENEKISGISEILSRVLVTAEVEEKFEELGGKIKSNSGNNSLGFGLDVIGDNIAEALKLLCGIILKPKIDARELAVQKNIQIGKIKNSEIDLFHQGFKLVRKAVYKKHPYRLMPEGTLDSVSALNEDKLRSFISRVFLPNNCVISIAGEIDFDKVQALVQNLWGGWIKKEIKTVYSKDGYPGGRVSVSKKIPQREVVVNVGFMVPEINSRWRYCLDVIQMLVSGQGSLFFNKIRRELGSAYTLGGGLFLGPDPGLISFYVATTPEEEKKVIDKVNSIIRDLREGNISEEEIEDAKVLIKTNYLRDTITNSSVSFHRAVDEILGLGYQEMDYYLDKIQALTKKELLEFVNEYIDPQKEALVKVGNI